MVRKNKQPLIAATLALVLTTGLMNAESPAAAKIEFEVASVKPSKPGDSLPTPPFPWGPEASTSPTAAISPR